MTLPDQFITERRIFKNAALDTIHWYNGAFKSFDGALQSRDTSRQTPPGTPQRNLGQQLLAVPKYVGPNTSTRQSKIPGRKKNKNPSDFEPGAGQAACPLEAVGRNDARPAHHRSGRLAAQDTGLRIGERLGFTRQNVDLDNLRQTVRAPRATRRASQTCTLSSASLGCFPAPGEQTHRRVPRFGLVRPSSALRHATRCWSSAAPDEQVQEKRVGLHPAVVRSRY